MPASDSATATLTIGRKALRRVARAALEQFERLAQIVDVDVVLNDERRALQPVDRLARDHLHRMNGADRGGVDRIEPDQRAGRHEDATAIGAGEIDQIEIVEQTADADDDCGLAALHRGLDDRAQLAARRAFDHDVGGVAELVDRQNFRRAAQAAQEALVFRGIAHRHGGERQPLDALIERSRDLAADRAQACDGNPQFVRSFLFSHRNPPSRQAQVIAAHASRA